LAGERVLTFAAEQAEGGATPQIQGDRLQLGFVRMRDGQEVLLGVVADGGRSPQSGEVATITIRAVADAVSQSSSEGLSRALASGLQRAAAAWKVPPGEPSAQLEVSATAVCVLRRRLYAAHAGRSSAFLVRAGQAYPLMKPTGPLGASRADPVAGPREGLELQPGDWVVIASDGLTRTSGETGRPFVDPSEIPGYLRGSEPREAARHLISIALGRDADDNVSVGLIRVPGEVRRRSVRPVLVGIAAAAAVLIAGLAGAALINRTLGSDGFRVRRRRVGHRSGGDPGNRRTGIPRPPRPGAGRLDAAHDCANGALTPIDGCRAGRLAPGDPVSGGRHRTRIESVGCICRRSACGPGASGGGSCPSIGPTLTSA
jgi:serine/threonine protein phosphatase PrpC